MTIALTNWKVAEKALSFFMSLSTLPSCFVIAADIVPGKDVLRLFK